MKNEFTLLEGDNLNTLKTLPDNSVDSVVTDPPYGLSFMNKKWDYDVPSVELWREVYRVLKPGGHLLSFGGTRTYHRMVVNIEDAGFEIRDQIMWLYGSGFPKSLNIGKAIDKVEGNEREVIGDKPYLSKNITEQKTIGGDYTKKNTIQLQNTKGNSEGEGWGTGLKPANEPIVVARKPISENTIAENFIKWGVGGFNIDECRVGIEGEDDRSAGRRTCNIFDEVKVSGGIDSPEYIPSPDGRFPANIILECICDEVIKGDKGEVIIRNKSITHNNFGKRIQGNCYTDKGDIHTNPECPCRLLDDQSGQSKSSSHKIEMRPTTDEVGNNYKMPLYHRQSTFSDNGGASRFFYVAKTSKAERNMGLDEFEDKENPNATYGFQDDEGDIHTNPECPCRLLDDQSGNSKSVGGKGEATKKSLDRTDIGYGYKKIDYASGLGGYLDSGGASRFFYVAKTSKAERNMGVEKNNHPTVKPVNLMSYLCKLVTPNGGVILDPFLGSGGTGIAALLNGFKFIGCELDPEYCRISEARISQYEKYKKFLKK